MDCGSKMSNGLGICDGRERREEKIMLWHKHNLSTSVDSIAILTLLDPESAVSLARLLRSG